MQKNVLVSGNCNIDHPKIEKLLLDNFNVSVNRAKTNKDAMSMLKKNKYELVLVNRVGAFDSELGIEIIDFIKKTIKIQDTPVMLLTNHDNYMKESASHGAVQGFGKSSLEEKSTINTLKKYLS